MGNSSSRTFAFVLLRALGDSVVQNRFFKWNADDTDGADLKGLLTLCCGVSPWFKTAASCKACQFRQQSTIICQLLLLFVLRGALGALVVRKKPQAFSYKPQANSLSLSVNGQLSSVNFFLRLPPWFNNRLFNWHADYAAGTD